MEKSTLALCPLFLVLLWSTLALGGHDYGQALSKDILFFEAQRSGYLPSTQRVTWRANSSLSDGKASGVDLVGGYYDAGDNVKFGLPMAFTVTMMSWSILEYGKQMAAGGELSHAIDAVKWGTDYFIKAHPEPHVLYGEVGDGNTDHYCWQRPEDMTTDRRAYRIDQSNPGSDLAGETAAAMAAASIVFRHSNAAYSSELLRHAEQLFEFADKYRGKYDGSITMAQKYYRSISGYNDELLWAAAWLYQATNNQYYLGYLAYNGDSLGGTGWGWDVKYAGVQTLVAKLFLGIIICTMLLHMYFAHPSMLVDYPPNAKAAPENLKELKDLPKHPLIFNLGGIDSPTGFDLTINDWLIDSGASMHCTPQGHLLTEFSEESGHVSVANGHLCEIIGKGTMILDNPGGGFLALKETLHVPDLKRNVISISALDKQGFTTTFGGGEWKITSEGNLVASGKRADSLYFLKVNNIGNNMDNMTAAPMEIDLVAEDMDPPDSPNAGGVFLVSSHFPPKDNDLVPIVEPDTLLDGDQPIEDS